MKWRLLLCCYLLFATCSCGAKFYAQQTSVEFYRPDGSVMGKVFSNKGYDEFHCKVKTNECGETELDWSAAKVNSNTVANTALESNKEMTKAFTGLVRKMTRTATPFPPFNRQ